MQWNFRCLNFNYFYCLQLKTTVSGISNLSIPALRSVTNFIKHSFASLLTFCHWNCSILKIWTGPSIFTLGFTVPKSSDNEKCAKMLLRNGINSIQKFLRLSRPSSCPRIEPSVPVMKSTVVIWWKLCNEITVKSIHLIRFKLCYSVKYYSIKMTYLTVCCVWMSLYVTLNWI